MYGLLATKRIGVGLSALEIIFQDFQHMWSQSTNVTDGQTDGQTDAKRSQYRAMHMVHRAVKKYTPAKYCTQPVLALAEEGVGELVRKPAPSQSGSVKLCCKESFAIMWPAIAMLARLH